MSASERIQEQKDVALASVKTLLEKDGKELPKQAEINISNKVKELDGLVGGGIQNIFGAISGGFGSLISNVTNAISSLDFTQLSSSISNLSSQFESALGSLESNLNNVKDEELNNRVDKQASESDPYEDGYGILTYTELTKLKNEVSEGKHKKDTILKLESTRAYYVVVLNNGVFTTITLFNYNMLRKRLGEEELKPSGSVEISSINNVKNYVGTIKK